MRPSALQGASRAGLALGLVLLVLSGCGRRGDLEPPVRQPTPDRPAETGEARG